MENMYFKDKKELDDYISEHMVKVLGYGREGRCYLLDTGYSIKRLYHDWNPEFVTKFKNVENPSFQFAKAAAICEGDAYGVFCVPALGKDISERKPIDQDMVILGEDIEEFVHNMNDLSKEGIQVVDFFPTNMIYDYNHMVAIDTLAYLYVKGFDYTQENITEVMPRLYKHLLGDILSYDGLYRYTYIANKDYQNNPKQYFKDLRDYIRMITGEEVNTIEEAEKALQRTL